MQIKGHIDEKREYIDKQKISYPVELDDLEVYFQDRGVLYFEVFMSKDGKAREIFYASLFPIKIKYYLEKAEYKGNKQTINVTFIKIEKNSDVFYKIVKQFSNESKQQGFGHEQIVQSAIKFREINKVTELSASVVGVSNDIEFMKRLGDGDVVFYAAIEGCPLKIPLEWHEEDLHFLWKKINRGVYVSDKRYYKDYKIKISSKDEITFIPSDNLAIDLKRCKLNFNPQTGINSLRRDAEFLLAVIEYSGFKTANTFFTCKNIEKEEVLREKLQLYIDLDDTLSMIEFEYKKPFKEISEDTIKDFFKLISIRKGKQNKSFTEDAHIFNWKIDNKYVPITVYINRSGGENRLFNAIYTKRNHAYVCDCNGNYFEVPLYSYIDVHVLANLYEYRYEYFYEQIDEAVIKEETAETLNYSALNLIKVYDENKDEEMLKIALYTLNKLKDVLGENIYYLINELQIKKRQGTLGTKDKNWLMAIESDDLQLLCAKSILLEDKQEAIKYFDSMTEEEKVFFSDLPIHILYQELVTE